MTTKGSKANPIIIADDPVEAEKKEKSSTKGLATARIEKPDIVHPKHPDAVSTRVRRLLDGSMLYNARHRTESDSEYDEDTDWSPVPLYEGSSKKRGGEEKLNGKTTANS